MRKKNDLNMVFGYYSAQKGSSMSKRKLSVWSIGFILVFLLVPLVSAQTGATLEPITPENATQVMILARLGFGSSNAMALAPDGSSMVVATTTGIWMYDPANVFFPPQRLGLDTNVNVVAYHPESNVLASGAADGSVRSWQLTDRSEIHQISEEETPVTAIAYRPDGDMLAVGDEDGVVWLWTMPDGLPVTSFALHDAPVTGLGFNSNGQWLISGSADGSLGFYDVEALTSLGDVQNVESEVYAVQFNPTADQVAVGAGDEVLLIDMVTDAVIPLDLGASESRSMTYSPDGMLLAAPGLSGNISLWNTQTGEKMVSLQVEPEQNLGLGDPISMAFSPDGALLFVLSETTVGTGGVLRIWDVEAKEMVRQTSTGFSYFNNVIFHPMGYFMVAVGHPPVGNQIIHVWDTATFQEQERLISPTGEDAIAFNSNGELLASSGKIPLLTSPEERDEQNGIRLWDTSIWQVVDTLDGHTGAVKSLTFHPYYSNILVSGTAVSADEGENGIYVWMTDTGELLQHMEGHTGAVQGMTFSPDGSILFSAGDETVRLWEWQTGSLAQSVPFDFTPVGIAISPTNSHLAVAASGGSGVTRALTPTEAEQEISPGYVSSTPSRIAFNPAGTLVAVVDNGNQNIVLFDLVNEQVVTILTGHTAPIYSVKFNPTGTILASAAGDGSIRLWSLPLGEE